jgi:hypothetical protein
VGSVVGDTWAFLSTRSGDSQEGRRKMKMKGREGRLERKEDKREAEREVLGL